MPVTRGHRVAIPENEIRGGQRKRKDTGSESRDPADISGGSKRQMLDSGLDVQHQAQEVDFRETEVVEEDIEIEGEQPINAEEDLVQYTVVEQGYADADPEAPNLNAESVEVDLKHMVRTAETVVETVEDQFSAPPQLELESGPGQPESEPLPEGGLENVEEGEHATVVLEHGGRPVTITGPVTIDDQGRRVIQLPPGEYEALTGGIDEDQLILEGVEGPTIDDSMIPADLRTVEFNFLDNKNICCGLCGEIVPYETLMSEHLPQQHPEILGDGSNMAMEEIPYEEWLREKLRAEKRAIESGFKLTSYESPARVHRSANRPQRRVSQIRVNPTEMSVQQLDAALKKKMVEKMGRKVPVTLVDKQHARCGLCNAVVSLNKKFEIVHLVRHFNAWHPSTHKCAGTWMHRPPSKSGAKPLSMHDFAVIDSNNQTPDNLQCIWCGMFMDTDSLAMHFDEVHPDEIEVPKCNLCLQELVLNARMQEKYGDDFDVTLPDEHHIRCGKYGSSFGSENALERGVERRLARGVEAENDGEAGGEEDDELGMDDPEDMGPEAFLNSRMALGRRKKPKRQFIMPALRQAAPIDSEFVEPVTECHWRCKKCSKDILAAVISAGAIKHFRADHPEHLDNMQYELCKARLERVSDGCMEFVHPQLIECLLCNMTYNLHKPFNMCRAIRHLKSKHPNLMPEYAGMGEPSKPLGPTASPKVVRRRPGAAGTSGKQDGIQLAMVDNIEALNELYGIDISKMEGLADGDGDQVFVLMPEGEELDPETAAELARVAAGVGREDGQEAPGSRIFTLAVGKQGNATQNNDDKTDGKGEEGSNLAESQEAVDSKSTSEETEMPSSKLSDTTQSLPPPSRNSVPPMPDLLTTE